MTQVIMAAGALIVHLLLFYVFSFLLEKIFTTEFKSIADRMVFGMLGYFSAFQLLCVPMAYIGFKYSVLCIVWPFIVLIACGIATGACKHQMERNLNALTKSFNSKEAVVLMAVAAVLCGLLCIYSVLRTVNGWDTGYYISVINEALTTDYFYNYEGNTGIFVENIVDKTALNSFYLQFGFWCNLFGVTPRIMILYCTRGLCVILSAMTAYLFALEIFKDRKRRAITVIVWVILNLFSTGSHTAGFFMIMRGCEAKAWCASIILPLTFLTLFKIFRYKDSQELVKDNFKKLFIIGFASVPISMSALAVFPVCVAVATLALMIYGRSIRKYLGYGICCCIPNAVYMGIYYGKRLTSIIAAHQGTLEEGASVPAEVAETEATIFNGTVKEFIDYIGSYVWLILFIAVVFYLFIRASKNGKKAILITAVVSVVCIFNSASARIIGLFYNIGTYYRFFWMMPVIILVAIVLTDVITRDFGIDKRLKLAVQIVAPVITAASLFVGADCFLHLYTDFPETAYQMPFDVYQIAELIDGEGDIERPVLALPREIDYVYRSFDSSCTLALGRFGENYIDGKDPHTLEGTKEDEWATTVIYNGVNNVKPVTASDLRKALDYKKVDYVACIQEENFEKKLVMAGYHLVSYTWKYSLYKADVPKSIEVEYEEDPVKLNELTIDIPGVKTDSRICVINDMHIVTDDKSVGKEYQDKVYERYNWAVSDEGIHSADMWKLMSEKVDEQKSDILVFAGDMIDYGAQNNLDIFTNSLENIQTPSIYLRADHDVGEWYSNNMYDRQACIKLSKKAVDWQEVYSVDMGDYILLGWNNSTVYVSEDGRDVIEKALSSDKPIILVTHVPLDSKINDEVYDAALSADDKGRAKIWGERGLYKPEDETTQYLLDAVYAQDSPFVAVICGHLHIENTAKLTDTVTQYILGPSFKGNLEIINIK